MDFLQEQFLQYKARYDSFTRLYLVASKYGGPVVNKALAFGQRSLFDHPDLTSVALLLVVLYISFVFLVRAWRLTIGTIMFSFKATFITFLGVCLLGVYNSIVNNDSSILNAIWISGQRAFQMILATSTDHRAHRDAGKLRAPWS